MTVFKIRIKKKDLLKFKRNGSYFKRIHSFLKENKVGIFLFYIKEKN